MEKIKNFFDNLPSEFSSRRDYGNVVSLTKGKTLTHQTYNTLILLIQNNHYIKNILIPFFKSMIWISKKELDYKDWKTVLNLKQLVIITTTL